MNFMFEIRKHEKLDIYNTLSFTLFIYLFKYFLSIDMAKRKTYRNSYICAMEARSLVLLTLSAFVRFARFLFEHFIIWGKTIHFLITKQMLFFDFTVVRSKNWLTIGRRRNANFRGAISLDFFRHFVHCAYINEAIMLPLWHIVTLNLSIFRICFVLYRYLDANNKK